jgi:DNA invertase Pin-like site-specific DNA recombinase
MTKKAVAYLRVSSKGQVDGYGLDRQKENIQLFSDKNEYDMDKFYHEEGISGTTNEFDRPAFKEMIIYVVKEKIDFIIVEAMDRLARELRIQENLCVYLASKNIQLVSANTGENITKAIEGDPMKKALIQMQGVFAELDKNTIVKKLKNGRDKARQESGAVTLDGSAKCEGRKSYKEINGKLVTIAKKLYRKPRKGERLSLLRVSAKLFEMGYSTRTGKPFSSSQIGRLVK